MKQLKRAAIFFAIFLCLSPIYAIPVYWAAITAEMSERAVRTVIAITVVIAAATAGWFSRLLIARRLRLGIREMLLMTAVIAVFCATYGKWFVGLTEREIILRDLSAAGVTVRALTKSENTPFLSYDASQLPAELILQDALALDRVLVHRDQLEGVTTLLFFDLTGGLTPQQAEELNEMPQLRELRFFCPVTHADLQALSHWTRGEKIYFGDGTGLGPEFAGALSGVRNLKALTFESFGDPPLTPNAIQGLAGCRQLRSLTLSLCNLHVDNGVADALCELKQLRRLDIPNTPVSRDAAKRLREALPSTEIYTDSYLAD